tara:strand:- start:286 stop:564 length:279 start_codon:yes stop_codon:yes gene_type:complete
MANYAVVKNGLVENIIVWDGVQELPIPDAELILVDEDARIGGTHDGAFHFVEYTLPEPTAEQVAAAEAKASAIGKLKSLGLNDAEIASITGG